MLEKRLDVPVPHIGCHNPGRQPHSCSWWAGGKPVYIVKTAITFVERSRLLII
ncbi:hypothetical protein VFPPC_17467 [Pochonia chlamydosporia 170]|uniref:Uncharacterized protein n=1 Tax=Pochonia chlamydosporia 170 TaxID=1380566 RepID=A0A219ARH9_METCM|nr:hypothetical protein VFPPC_17467 [Pochonia chlamydosporia 170]OWT43370.1 hypothetical protein VFPPC_17467 [Pochonia chlamydosporia 170]